MDILIITPTLFKYPITSYAGIEYMCQELALGLVERGHNVDMVAPIGSKLDGVNIIGLVKSNNQFNMEPMQYDLLKKLPLSNYDIIHDNTHLCEIYKHEDINDLPVIWTYHNNPILGLDRKPPVKYPCIVSISKWQQRALRTYNIDSKLVYNGINLNYYEFKEDKDNRLLFLSRIFKQKGCHISIDVARQLNMPLDIAGGLFLPDENYVNYIERVSKTINCKFYGQVDNEVRKELFSNDKYFILPLLDNEPFGIVVIEAMASGCIPVVFNKGSMNELIEDGKSGYLCRDEADMINKIKNSDIDPNECRKQSLKFTTDIMVENYLKVYNRIIRGDVW